MGIRVDEAEKVAHEMKREMYKIFLKDMRRLDRIEKSKSKQAH